MRLSGTRSLVVPRTRRRTRSRPARAPATSRRPTTRATRSASSDLPRRSRHSRPPSASATTVFTRSSIETPATTPRAASSFGTSCVVCPTRSLWRMSCWTPPLLSRWRISAVSEICGELVLPSFGKPELSYAFKAAAGFAGVFDTQIYLTFYLNLCFHPSLELLAMERSTAG